MDWKEGTLEVGAGGPISGSDLRDYSRQGSVTVCTTTEMAG